MTETVISSASVIFGAIPIFGRHRLSCGDAFSSSSILQYSAVARVSRSTCTWPPWSRCSATSIMETLVYFRYPVPLGIDRLEVGRQPGGALGRGWLASAAGG